MDSAKLSYTKAGSCTDDIITKCAALFSSHYGVWESTGKRVSLSPAKLKALCMHSESCGLVYAEENKAIVGHCFFVGVGQTVWITQLVVHSDFRGRGVATTMLHMALGLDWQLACIVSSHPYAIRGFEHAAGLRAVRDPLVMEACPVPYLKGKRAVVDEHQSVVDTEFPISHAEIEPVLCAEVLAGKWRLGNALPKGHEFLAVVRRGV